VLSAVPLAKWVVVVVSLEDSEAIAEVPAIPPPPPPVEAPPPALVAFPVRRVRVVDALPPAALLANSSSLVCR